MREFIAKWRKVELKESSAARKLDAAVFAAYGCPADLTADQILEKLLELNLERAEKADEPS